VPFDNPYFPQTFDVGNQGGAHLHFDATGEYFYRADGTIAYQLLPAESTWFGTDGSSIAVHPGASGGSNPAQLIFHRAARANNGLMNAGDYAGTSQSFLAWQAPQDFNSAELVITSDDHVNNLPTEVDLFALNAGIVLKGPKPAGGAGSHGSFDLGVPDDAGSLHHVTYDGTVFAVAGEVHSIGISGGHSFDDRVSGLKWEWYAHDGMAALWNPTNGDVVTIDTSGVVRHLPLMFSGWNTGGPAIGNAAWTNISYGAANQAGGFNYAVGSGNASVIIPRTGYYRVTGHFDFASNATGFRASQIRKNSFNNVGAGAEMTYVTTGGFAGTSNGCALDAGIWRLAAGDEIELWVYQNSGGNLATVANESGLMLCVEYIGE
jgi:hypothetical protein